MEKRIIFFILVIIIMLISFIYSRYIMYQVVTYDNEILNVQGYELYGSDMIVVHNDETILIKSYKELE